MKKLKCWRKSSNTKYTNKKRKGILYVGKNSFNGKQAVNIQIDTVKIDGASFPRTVIYEEFETKPKALTFAQKYMEEHDSC